MKWATNMALYNEQLCDLYRIKEVMMGWICSLGKGKRSAYRTVVRKPLGEWPFERVRMIWKVNTEMVFK
jgi:hypothetical protein